MSDAASLPSIVNFREAGGLPTVDGRQIRTGVLFRSAHLASVTDEDLARLGDLGVRTVIDLRTAHDIAADGEDRLPDGVERLHHPVGDIGSTQVDIRKLVMGGSAADIEAAFGNGRAEELMASGSSFYVTDERMRDAVSEALSILLAPKRQALLVHCSAGKDRTGWICAAMQLALGAEREAIIENYVASNAHRFASKQVESMSQHLGIDPAMLRPFIEVRAEYMTASLAEMERRHGDAAGYLASLGFSADHLAQMQAHLCE